MSRVNDFNRILTAARGKLPGALDTQIKSEMFFVIDEFMKDTDIWWEDIDMPVNTTDKFYDVVPSMGLANSLLEVRDSGDKPISAAMEIPGTIELQTTPAQADTFVAKVGLTVVDPLSNENLPQFPDWILAQYYPVFLNGVLSRMMATLGKPYYSPQGAVFHGKNFVAGKSQAMVNSGRKNKSGGQTWRFPKFA